MTETRVTDFTGTGASTRPFRILGLGRRVRLTPARITLLYGLFGFVALVLSDVVLARYLSGPLLRQVQALKGGVEVLLTAGLIFLLTRRSREQMDQIVDEAKRQRDELQLLHRVFRHNFRNDINVIRGFAEMAREEVTGTPAEARCERILDRTKQMENYSEQARRVRKVTELSSRPETFDVARMIERAIADHPRVSDDVDISTAIPAGTEVRANPMITQAIQEIITNAIRHTDAGAPSIAIEAIPGADSPSMTSLRFRDDGPGVPDSEIESLHADKETQLLHSTGLGLWFVNWVVTNSDGQLSIRTSGDEGTELVLTLPTA